MKAGYTISGECFFLENPTHVFVYNFHFLNEVSLPSYCLESDSQIVERPALDSIVAIFKIKPKCSEKKSS